MDRMTDTCENITFLWGSVKILRYAAHNSLYHQLKYLRMFEFFAFNTNLPDRQVEPPVVTFFAVVKSLDFPYLTYLVVLY